MPICQRRVTLGDGSDYFKATMDQAGNLSSQASGAATSKPPTRPTDAGISHAPGRIGRCVQTHLQNG